MGRTQQIRRLSSSCWGVAIDDHRNEISIFKVNKVFIYQNNVNQVPKKTGCPFSLLATQGKDGLWSVKVEIDQHNHPADTDEAASPLNRIKRLTKNELQDIHDGFENSDQPKSILSKHNHHSKATL
ncbi:hypothetical protein GcM3_187038, partial [Golovinomyces cichoracearum]